MRVKRSLTWALIALLSMTVSAAPAESSNPDCAASSSEGEIFRVGSGYNNGIYFIFATVLSAIISQPQGGLVCAHGGNCGVDNLLLVNVSTPGSAANVALLEEGALDAAFVQSNVAYWRYTASGLYGQDEPFDELRALASLYPEMLHLVVHEDSEIQTIEDLVGKRVAVGAKNSGTYINVSELFGAYGMDLTQFKAVYDDAPQAVEKFLAKELDAVFFVAGVPTPQVTYLSEQTGIRLIPVSSLQRDALLSQNHYYSSAVIPANIYPGIDRETPTLAVQALWVVRDDLDSDLAYRLTKALWGENRAYWLEQLLPDSALTVAHSLDGIGIPLHPGAKRFYDEIGKRF